MDARNWKWMVPAVAAVVCFLLARPLLGVARFDVLMGWPLVFVGCIFGVAAVGNFVDYRRWSSLMMLERRQMAVSQTPLSAELEAAKNVHPEVARMLINERKRAWMLRGQGRYDVLFGAPTVTDIFVKYVLENSSVSTVMPKRLLVEGRRNRFDPLGAVSEYEMYDDFVKLLVGEGKVHRWSEFSPWEWTPPWTPEGVAEDFRLVLEEVDKAEVSAVEQVSE